MNRLIILIALSTMLVGCAADPVKIAAADDARCRGYGLKPGTDAYGMCRANRDNARAMDESAWARHSRDLLLRD